MYVHACVDVLCILYDVLRTVYCELPICIRMCMFNLRIRMYLRMRTCIYDS